MSRALAIAAGVGVVGLGTLILLSLGDSPMPATSPALPAPIGQPGRYFSWAEFTQSGTASRLGLDNTPTLDAQLRIRQLCETVLDPLRLHLGRPVRITSGYRSPAVNKALKGASSTSQHMVGEAADIKVDGIAAEKLATIIVQLGLPFDQVIWYAPSRGGHVHVSHATKRANRGETRHAPAGGGYPAWSPRTA